MKLSLISEEVSPKELFKEGIKISQKELRNHTKDPAGLYAHCLKGAIQSNSLITSDKNYWTKMSNYWTHVPLAEQNKFFTEIVQNVRQTVQQLQASGVSIQEGIGSSIKSAISWIGKQATAFTKFLVQLITVIQQSQHGGRGYGGHGGQGRQRAVKPNVQPTSQQPTDAQPANEESQKVIQQLNTNIITTFVDKCIEYSTQALQQKADEPQPTPEDQSTAPAQPTTTSQPATPAQEQVPDELSL